MAKRLRMMGSFPGLSDEQVKTAVSEYLVKNPPETTGGVQTVNGIEPDESGNVEIEISEPGGKSAYAYAQEGGYEGTEEEFGEKLAMEPLVGTVLEITPTQVAEAVAAGRDMSITTYDATYGELTFASFVHIVTLGYVVSSLVLYYNKYIVVELIGKLSDNEWTMLGTELAEYSDIPAPLIGTTDEITPSQVKALMDAGKPFAISYTDSTYGNMLFNSFVYSQAVGDAILSSTTFQMYGTTFCAQLAGDLGSNKWGFAAFELVDINDIPTIPESLKNPNKLIVTDEALYRKEYDGSSEVTVKIPIVPPALKNPYALTINGTAYDGSKAVSMTIEGGSGDSIPDYVRTEAERVAKVVQSRQNADTLTFIAASDFHYTASDAQQKESMTHMGQAMELLRKMIHVDFTVSLGDMVWDSSETADEGMSAMRFVSERLYGGYVGASHLRARGNHDDLYKSGNLLTDNQIFANIGAWNKGSVYDPDNRLAGYCYLDFEDVKLRVILLNSAEVGRDSAKYSEGQITWLSGVLDLSSKGSDWCSIILSHHPLDWGRSDGGNPITAVNNASGLIASFHGHIHSFLTGTVTGTELPRICIPNACVGRENQYTTAYGVDWGESTTYSKTAGTAEDTSFCVITIDLAEKKIYADHYGAGYSRVISYSGDTVANYSVINNLTNVINSNSGETVSAGAPYSATLTAINGYTLAGGSVAITMGGADVTATAYTASTGKIDIDNVTGNIVITASAVVDQTGPAYTNRVSTSIDTDGSIYNGTGYQEGYRLNSSGTTTEASASGAINSGFIPYDGEVIRVYGSTSSVVGNNSNYVILYNADFSKNAVQNFGNWQSYGAVWSELDGKYMLTIDPATITNEATKTALEECAYIRCSLASCTGANFVVTLDEPIE